MANQTLGLNMVALPMGEDFQRMIFEHNRPSTLMME